MTINAQATLDALQVQKSIAISKIEEHDREAEEVRAKLADAAKTDNLIGKTHSSVTVYYNKAVALQTQRENLLGILEGVHRALSAVQALVAESL